MGTLMKDLRYAGRSLRKSPGFALSAVLTLALGIGASTAIFSVMHAVLLRPLPYADAGRLVLVWGDLTNRDVRDFPFPPGDFPDLREQGTLFQDVAAVSTFRQAVSGGDAEPEQVSVAGVTTNLLSLLGARVALGRNFVEADGAPQPEAPAAAPGPPPAAGARADVPELPDMAILSYDFWQRRFGGDRAVIGQSLDLGDGRAEIVGVLEPGVELLFPPGTNVDRAPELWTALRVDYARASRINVFLRVIARLEPGATIAQAQGQMDRLAVDLRRRFPIKETGGLRIRLEPMAQDLVADVRPAILALMGAVTFVLLIACANVANLLLVRAGRRERELAVRSALGGTRWRLVRQMLAESLVLAGAGVLLGVGLAWLGTRLLATIAPESLPRVNAVAIDPTVLAYAALAGLVSAAVFGTVPALRASRTDVADVLRAGGRTAGLQRGRMLTSIVVVTEVALSFVLLVGSGLMFRSFRAMQQVNPGFDPRGVLTFAFANPRAREPEERAVFAREVSERLRALPGVTAVTAAGPLPLDGGVGNARWGTERALTDPTSFQQANLHVVLPGYFDALRTRLLAGRVFTEADNVPAATVVVIDDRLAAKAFPGTSAVGKRVLARVRSNEPEWLEVIGVVAHQRHETLAAPGREALFLTDGEMGHGRATRWAVRTSGDPARLAAVVRADLGRAYPLVPLAEVQPMQMLVDRAAAPTRFALVLIGVFAAIAAILAAVGLYGVLSSVVRQRTAEIGLRMAFGAQKSRIFGLVIGQGLRLSATGIALGLAGALALTRVMRSMLVGVAPTDPATFAAIALLFVVIAAVACWLPAQRAAGLDPTVALREE
ncbi:MAG: ABC transporter permease [Gemmatimonadaceae bacterium]